MSIVFDSDAHVVYSYCIFDLLSKLKKVVNSEYSFDDFIETLMFVNLQTVINVYHVFFTSV